MLDTSLTNRQAEVLLAIRNYIEREEMPPTLRELCGLLGIGSTNGINDHLAVLERKGYLRRKRNVSRGIQLTRAGRR